MGLQEHSLEIHWKSIPAQTRRASWVLSVNSQEGLAEVEVQLK